MPCGRCAPQAGPGLKRHGQDDQPQSAVKRRVQIPRLAEKKHGDDDAVYRLKIVGKVHGKGGNAAQRLNLQYIQEKRAKQGQKKQFNRVPAGRKAKRMARERKIDRQQQADAGCPAQHLVQQRGQGVAPGTDALVAHGEQGGQRRSQHAHGNTQPIARVKMKNQPHPGDGNQAEQHLPRGNAPPIEQRFKQRGEESHRGKTDHADRDVGRLDTAVKTDPVQSKQQPRAARRPCVPQSGFLLSAAEAEKDEQHERGKQQTIPDQQPFIQRDEFAEHAGKPGQKNGKMQFEKSVVHGVPEYPAPSPTASSRSGNCLPLFSRRIPV